MAEHMQYNPEAEKYGPPTQQYYQQGIPVHQGIPVQQAVQAQPVYFQPNQPQPIQYMAPPSQPQYMYPPQPHPQMQHPQHQYATPMHNPPQQTQNQQTVNITMAPPISGSGYCQHVWGPPRATVTAWLVCVATALFGVPLCCALCICTERECQACHLTIVKGI